MDEVVAFLESARRRYPFGVPASLIDSVKAAKTSAKIFIVGDSLTTSGRELLVSAIEKGLKWKEFEIFIASKSIEGEVKSAVTKGDKIVIIAFGDVLTNFDLVPGTVSSVYGCPTLRTIHPDAVSKDPSLKREYWTQLQKLIPELN